MRVVVAKGELKMFNGEEYINPNMGDIITLPDEIAKAEIKAGFVSRLEGEEPSSKKMKKKLKKKVAREEEPDEDEEVEEDD